MAKAKKPAKSKPKPAGKAKPAKAKAKTKSKRAVKRPAPRPPLPVFDEHGAAGRAIVAARGDHIVLGIGQSFRAHVVDHPLTHITHGARLVAVAQTETHAASLDRLGVLTLYEVRHLKLVAGAVNDPRLELSATRPVGGTPRSMLALPDGRFVVLHDTGLAVFDGAGHTIDRVEYPRPLVAASDGESLVIVGEDRRLAEWRANSLVDIPESVEQIVAIAAIGPRKFACIGQHNAFVLDLDLRELELLDMPVETPMLAASPSGARVAISSTTQVVIGSIANKKFTQKDMVTYGGTYSTPNESMTVNGLAWLDENRLVIALDHGRANIIDFANDNALKLDAQPGDPHSSWVFVFNAHILVAG